MTGVAPASDAARATMSATPGRCAAETTCEPGLMIPTFSPATCSGVSPSME